MDDEEQQFIKGFNAGYQLSKHEPELLERILKSPTEDVEYLHAMRLGKKQHDREKLLEQLKKKQSKDQDRER